MERSAEVTFWQIIKKSCKDFYNHLFLLVGVSLIWFFTVGPLFYVGAGGIFLKQPLLVVMGLIFVGPLTIAGFYLTNQLIRFREARLKEFFDGFVRFFLRGMLAYWFNLVILLILVVDLYVFLNMQNWMAYLSGIWIYLILFFLMSQIYFWSLLVETEEGIFKSYKRAVLLTLDNLIYSLAIFFMFLLLFIVGIVTVGVGFAVTFMGFLGILANNATYNLLVKYDLREELFSTYKLD